MNMDRTNRIVPEAKTASRIFHCILFSGSSSSIVSISTLACFSPSLHIARASIISSNFYSTVLITNSTGDSTSLFNSKPLFYSLSERLKFSGRVVNKMIVETVRLKSGDFISMISYVEANLQRLRSTSFQLQVPS